MNEEQIKELLTTTLSDFKADLLSAVDEKNSGLAKNVLSRVEKQVAPPKEDESKLTLKALQDQIKDLNASLKAKDEAAFNAERKAKISELISSSDITNPSGLNKIINATYGNNLVKEDGKWYVQDGESVKEFDTVYSEYLESDEGSFFIKPSTTQGSGSSQGEKVTSTKEIDKDALIMEAFSQF